MKAITFARYGSSDVLSCKEVDKPAPKANEILVKVHAVSANAGDKHLMQGKPFVIRLIFGFLRPKVRVLGLDIAGVVEAVGKDVSRFRPGDHVFGDLSTSGFGGFAEYACIREDSLALKPADVSFAQAAALPTAGATALQGLREHGQIQAGQKVLVLGASGGVGSFAVMLAKHFGAEVTAVCSTQKMEMVRSLGPDHVIDYTQQDPTQTGQQYDLILDAAAFRPFLDYKPCMTPQGRYVMAGGGNKELFQLMFKGWWASKKGGQTFKNYLVRVDHKDLTFLGGLLAAGEIKPFIDKTYTLPQTADAMRALETRDVKGTLVVSVV